MSQKKGKLVYSTRNDADTSGRNPRKKIPSLPPQQQTIRVRLEKKGRRGKTVTVAEGFSLNPADLKSLEKTLKQFCGSGGTSKADTVEIQGDHRDKVVEKLTALNYNAKRAGG